jgi:phosphosulfolactate phosphohydrolase-like enzyme
MKRLRVLMTREEIVPDRLAGAIAVVVDVFLATTKLLTILENGARQVSSVANLEIWRAPRKFARGLTPRTSSAGASRTPKG